MKQILIIAFIFISTTFFAGCPAHQTDQSQDDRFHDVFISDQFGFKINNLSGFKEDKLHSDIAWSILTLRKPDIRVQFGYIPNVRLMSEIPGIPSPTLESLLSDWVMGMIETSKFYPGTKKTILSTKYSQIDQYLALVTDILLEFDQELYDEIDKAIRNISQEDLEFFENHPRALLRTYHFYREKDLVHIEVFSHPLAFQSNIHDLENTVIPSIEFTR